MHKKLAPLAALAAVAALSPATALGAGGNWSSPVQIVPPGSDPLAASAHAFVTPDGRSLVVGADGLKPVTVSGDARGVFGAPAAAGPEHAGTSGVDAAMGADGTVAIGWAAGGAGHVSVLRPGATAPLVLDVPGGGAGVTGVAVAVGADGLVNAVYRVKESPSANRIVSASVAPGASAFGDGVVVDSGGSPLVDPSVAVGPGGAVAVVYRKLATRYRAEAAVRPGGASAFEAPQALSASAAPDLAPRVVFERDGTVLAAWGNPETEPTYALRPAGASAFGPAASVAAGDTGQSIDLVATPAGGAALAWAGNGVVRAAVAPAGGAFGAAGDVDRYGGAVLPQPSVAVAPDGTVSVGANHPDDGAVQVTDVGGASTLVGYGKPETLTPVSVAASGDRTIAVWRNVDGGISAATRSASAPAGGSPGEKPAGPDKVAPRLTFAGKSKKIRLGRRVPKTVSVRVRCSEPCVLSASGNLRTLPRGAKRKRVAPLPPYTGKKAIAGVQTLRLKLGTFAIRDLKKAMKSRRGGQLFLDIRGQDPSTNEGRLRLVLTLSARR